jgi:hypothetical protein
LSVRDSSAGPFWHAYLFVIGERGRCGDAELLLGAVDVVLGVNEELVLSLDARAPLSYNEGDVHLHYFPDTPHAHDAVLANGNAIPAIIV